MPDTSRHNRFQVYAVITISVSCQIYGSFDDDRLPTISTRYLTRENCEMHRYRGALARLSAYKQDIFLEFLLLTSERLRKNQPVNLQYKSIYSLIRIVCSTYAFNDSGWIRTTGPQLRGHRLSRAAP